MGNLVKIDRLDSFGFQIRAQKRDVADLVIGIVGYVLRHVSIKLQEPIDIGLNNRIVCGGLDPTELPVLLPQVRLDNLCCQQEL
jgi:hypothetical protein